MKIFMTIMIIGIMLLTGCAYDFSYKAKMTPHVEPIEIGKPIPLEAGLLITQESRERIFKSPPYPDYRGNFIIYHIEPYQLPIGQAFEEASLQTFSQIFQKVHLIRNAEEAKNYPVVIEPKLADFNLSLYYSNYGLYIYNELVDGQCGVKITGTLLTKGGQSGRSPLKPPWKPNIGSIATG